MEGGEDAAAGFGEGRAFDEEVFPDVVGLFPFRHAPELFVGQFAGGDYAEDFGDEVVIGDQLVDAPEHEAGRVGFDFGVGDGRAEGRRVEVRVHVAHGLVGEGAGDGLLNGSAIGEKVRHNW